MNINILGNVEVTEAIRSSVEKKLERISRYFEEDFHANVAIHTYK